MDFSNLRYNITTIPPGKTVIDTWPELSDYPEFKPDYRDTLFRLMVLVIDEGSPYVKLYKDDYSLRVKKSAEYLQYNDIEITDKIIRGEHSVFNAMITRYFMISDNLAFVMWQSMFMNFHYNAAFLREPPDFDDIEKNMEKRVKVEAQLPGVHKRLIEFEKEIFNNDAPVRKGVRQQTAKILQLAEQYADEKTVI